MGSYAGGDLSGRNLDALLVYGSNDLVLNRESYNGAKSKLPARARECEIAGDNHAYYGNYGEQKGDGQASITREQQQEQTSEALVELALEAGESAQERS
ncbi:MAG: hypothetical protein IKF14_09325 [Atopobiaceae bacterium]|nr:hypothetical protein [Atopobiaceae bacterium]